MPNRERATRSTVRSGGSDSTVDSNIFELVVSLCAVTGPIKEGDEILAHSAWAPFSSDSGPLISHRAKLGPVNIEAWRRTCHSERSEESKYLVRNHDATRLTGPSLGALRFFGVYCVLRYRTSTRPCLRRGQQRQWGLHCPRARWLGVARPPPMKMVEPLTLAGRRLAGRRLVGQAGAPDLLLISGPPSEKFAVRYTLARSTSRSDRCAARCASCWD